MWCVEPPFGVRRQPLSVRRCRGSLNGVSVSPHSQDRPTVLTRSRGMGASALLGCALLASYGALAAVALDAVSVGGVLGFPGSAVKAVIHVDAPRFAASPPPGYGGVPGGSSAPSSGGGTVAGSPTVGGGGDAGSGPPGSGGGGKHGN